MRRPITFALSSASLVALGLALMPTAALAQSAPPQNCDSLPESERAACVADQAQTPPPPPPATTAGPQSDTIVVTGSRIARPNYDTVQPSVVVSSESIERRGFETLGQALNELPAFGVPGSSPVGGQSAFGPGQSFVNFLGLGDQRTLTLVNGNRFVSSNTSSLFGPTGAGSQVDLNLIPTALIDRVEVIAVGGAPIYGSDAIAGTINIILKRNFDGVQLDAQYGITEYGDLPNYRFRVLAGHNFGNGRGNITFAGEYNRQPGGLIYTQRPVLARGDFYGPAADRNSPFAQQLYSNQHFNILSEFGIPLATDFFPLDPTPNATAADYAELFGLDPATAAFYAHAYPSQNALYCGIFGYCGNFTNAQGQPLRFDASGNLVPIDFGTRPGPNQLPLQFGSAGGNGLDLNRVSNLVTPLERYSAVGLFNYELTDHIRFVGEAWYSHSSGTNLYDQPAYNSAAFAGAGDPGGNIIMHTDNPFLSPQARAIIQAQDPSGIFYLARANTDISTRRATGTVDVFRFVGGLEGTFDVGGHEWRWNVTGNYGHSRTKGHNPEIIEQNFNNAVDAVSSGGQIVCRPGYTNSAFPTGSATCAPLNLFGFQQASQAAIDYITGFSTPRSVNTQWVATASLTGTLFDLPGGRFGFAVGAEHRRESFDFNPGPLLLGGPDTDPTTDSDGDGNPANDCSSFTRDACITPVVGSFHTNEVFGELRAPIISPYNNVPFVNLFELQAALRYVSHSSAGSDPTWTVGGRWAPIRDITFRANYTRSIRSPAVGEISLPRSPGFFFAVDPCDARQLGNGPDPATRAANCAAAGIPTNFQSRSNQATFGGVTVGNPDLQNERARAWSAGVVFQPRFLPNFTASFDYVNINLRNAISFFGADQVLASCYDSPDFPNTDFCNRFTRNATPGPNFHQLNFVETSFFNADRLQYQGVLGELDYHVPTPFLGANSQLAFNASAQYLAKLEEAAGSGLPVISRGGIGYPKWSAVGTVSYTNHDFLFQVQANYTGSVHLTVNDPPNTYPDNTLDSVTLINVAMAYNVGEHFTFRISVDNLFSTNFPSPGPGLGGVITYFPTVLGTLYRVGAQIRF
jgi:outer membrane receptor protein involved in Fe transport